MIAGLRGAAVALALVAGGAVEGADISILTPGADRDLRRALVTSSLLVDAEREGTTDPQELLAAARADYARLLGVLYSEARYGGVINILVDGREAAAIPPLAAPRRIDRISVTVRPGPVYLFSEAQIAPLAPRTDLPEGFVRGEPAETGVIADAAAAAVEGWRAVGHAKAELVDQRITANHDSDRIAARLRMAPGPELRFGTVTVRGNRAVRTQRILKIAGIEEGRRFDPDEIARAERRLRRTGTFRSVVITEADAIGPNSTLPLVIGVAEQTPRRFGVGAELSSVEGLRLSGFWLHRNLLGGAERFRVEGEIAGIGGTTGGEDYRIGVRYERPATPRADTDLFVEASAEYLTEPDFTSTQGEFTLGFTRYASDDLTVNYGLGFVYAETEDEFESETFGLVTLPLGATLDRRNDALDPTEGYFADLDLIPFYGVTGTSSGARLEFDGRAYRSFDVGRRVTGAGRIQLGSLAGPALLESPPFYRFYSGGGGTVRGQDYQSLGVEIGGERTGGRSLLVLSGEVRADVTEAIQAVGFVDWGYVGEESFPDLSGESHAGAGIGVRYKTGIGPIRLDIAAPIYGDTESSGIYFYVGIGQAF